MIDKEMAGRIRRRMDAAMIEVANEFGLELEKPGPGRYTSGSYSRGGFEFLAEGEEDRRFEEEALRRGLPTDLRGKVITEDGVRYVVTGLNPNADRYVVLAARESDGEEWRFTADIGREAV